MGEQWTFASAGQVIFGMRAVERVGRLALWLGVRRPLIVSDRILVGLGIVDSVRRILAEAGLSPAVYDGGEPEPCTGTVYRCVEAARAGEHDSLIAVGGGSNIDTAKAAAVILSHGGSLPEYYGINRVPGPVLPLIAVPTTAGTGSEVSAGAVIADEAQGLKMALFSPHLRPRAAICDPLLTLTCPPKVTADSGMDALTHAIEAYTCLDHRSLPEEDDPFPAYPGANPLSASLALQAIGLIGQSLRQAVYQPQNLEAREMMHLAALLAGLAFSNGGLTITHALQYALAARVHNSHGEGNGLLLPYVMAYNLPACPQAFAEIARRLGEQVGGLSPIEAAHRSVEAVQRLKADVGVPMRLRDVGVGEADIPDMARIAASMRRLVVLNPRPVSAPEMEALLRAAY